jgi:hypothetical protein
VPGFIQGEEPTPINPSGSGGASEFVPYVGATENFDLGEFGMSAGFFKLDTTPTNTPTDQGTFYWDEDDNTVDIILNGYIMKVGEDLFYPVKNQTGSSIPKGTNVRFAGTVGGSGRLLIEPYLADGTFATSRYMGVTAETIGNGEDGKVLWFGRIRGINTNAYNEGDILYASTTSAGGFQTTLPVAPNNIVEVCAVVTKSVNQGVIFVRPQFLPNTQKIDWLTRTINNTSGDINALSTPTDYIEITTADAINGIVPTSSGWLRIVNRKTSPLLLRSNNTNALSANRLNIKFQFLTAGDGITLFYDRNTEKWIADDLYSNDIWEQFNLSSNTNNLGKNPATNRIRIGGSGAIELTGVANCQNGQLITIFNSKTSENITIKNNSLSSTDVNRFDIGADIILEPNRYLPFVHENGRLRRLLDEKEPEPVWVARSATEANSWRAITYGNGLFVAVSSTGTNRVMTSPDGINWTARSAAEANQWYSVIYGSGLFVAISAIGTNEVMTSPDGITWTARSASESNTWLSITYGNGLFVAVSNNGTNRVMTSPDGINWTARSAAEANQWRAITYGNGLFVALSGTGTNRVMTSPDGINWTARSAAEANSWYSVAYGNGLFVAVADTGTNRVMTSPDGINWTARLVPIDSWRAITYGNGLFVVVENGGTNRFMTSSDGINWIRRSAAEANQWFNVTYGNGLFVAVATSGTNRVMTLGQQLINEIPDNNQFNGDRKFTGKAINFSNLPTSDSGLSTGDLWNDGGTLKIVT